MTFPIPELPEILDQTQGDIESRIAGADARLKRRALAGISYSYSAAQRGLYRHQVSISKQFLPQDADMPALQKQGAMKGVFPKVPTAASFSIGITGNDGVVIGADTVLARADGAQFTVAADVIIAAGVATATVTAVVPGAAGTTTSGTKLSFAAPIAGVDSTATATSDGVGNDAESVEAFRGRVIFRWQNPPAGGRPTDYVGWATSLPGITRAWVEPLWQGAGTVGVTFVMDDNPISIIPAAPDLQVLKDFLVGTAANDFTDGVSPIMDPSNVIVFAPTPVLFNPAIHLSPSTAATQGAAWDNIVDLIQREAIPGGTIFLSHIEEAVETAAGVVDSTIVSPVANVVMTPGQLLLPGAATWV